MEGDGQSGNAQEIEEGERGVGPPRKSPEDVGDSSPDSAKMEAGQVMRDQSSSKFEIEIDDFRASGVELDGQPPDVKVQRVEEAPRAICKACVRETDWSKLVVGRK